MLAESIIVWSLCKPCLHVYHTVHCLCGIISNSVRFLYQPDIPLVWPNVDVSVLAFFNMVMREMPALSIQSIRD